MRRFLTSLTVTLVLIAATSAAIAENDRHCESRDRDRDRDRDHGGGNSYSVPELDPGSIGGALALLGLGSAILFDSRRPK